MQEQKCSKCGSLNVYRNLGANWHEDGLVIQILTAHNFPELFQTEAFLCLDCRNLELRVLHTSTSYGEQKTLAEALQASSNWQKV